MDGNGRWAKKRGLPRSAGHQHGIKAVKTTIKAALKYHIKYLTFYAFSTENFKRPQSEVSFLMNLFTRGIKKYTKNFVQNDIKFNTIGDLAKLPIALQESINQMQNETKNCSSLVVNIAVNYGARDEIVHAVQKIISNQQIDSIDWQMIKNNLYTFDIPDPDMIIRTSGEQRLSNFLLLQAAYSELYFVDAYWPDVTEETFVDILNEYSKRNRRMGNV